MWIPKFAAIGVLLYFESTLGFHIQYNRVKKPSTARGSDPFFQLFSTVPDFNAGEVAKTGGQGAVTASQKAADQGLSLGAPRGRPTGGHFLTKGGIQITANVEGLEY